MMKTHYEVTIHHSIPAPRGLVAIFVESVYALEPSAKQAYEKHQKEWDDAHPPVNGIRTISVSEIPDEPFQRYRRLTVTKEYDVMAFGSYDVVLFEHRFAKPPKEVWRRRESGAILQIPTGDILPVKYVDDCLPNLIFLGMELDGQPYGERYHLNARTDLGDRAPHGYTWMDNQGKTLKDTIVYRPSQPLPRAPTSYDAEWRNGPIEEGTSFHLEYDVEGDPSEEDANPIGRLGQKMRAREEERAAEMRRNLEPTSEEMRENMTQHKAYIARQKAEAAAKLRTELEEKYAQEIEREVHEFSQKYKAHM
jgi:hypothetical protein